MCQIICLSSTYISRLVCQDRSSCPRGTAYLPGPATMPTLLNQWSYLKTLQDLECPKMCYIIYSMIICVISYCLGSQKKCQRWGKKQIDKHMDEHHNLWTELAWQPIQWKSHHKLLQWRIASICLNIKRGWIILLIQKKIIRNCLDL